MATEPRINDKYPLSEHLSPPVVRKPIPECSEAVHVSGFIPHAKVQVWANGSELVGDASPVFGFADFTLTRPLKLGEVVTATQTVGAETSPPSLWPVTVTALPEAAVKNVKPDVGDVLYQCGILVPVDKLVPGVRVHVTEDGSEVGNEPTATVWHAVITKPLHANGAVSARQIACEGSDHEMVGPWADNVSVKQAPNPMPAPKVVASSLIPGNDTVTLTALLVGAGATVLDGVNKISTDWYATGPTNWFPVDPPLKSGSSITATQELCGKTSKPSDPEKPTGKLVAPQVLGPICTGATYVVVRGTTVNANVVIQRNGQTVGYGGAAPGDVVIALGGGASFNAGDVVTALQYMGSTVSPSSVSVTVTAGLGVPAIEILGGEPFFKPKAGELPIMAPVFPRGRGIVTIRVQTCCTKGVRAEILDMKGNLVTKLALADLAPGYYEGIWDWSSTSGWKVPDDIPVGDYTVRVETDCEQKDGIGGLFVIFNPDDVQGPPRFSFDDTTVWFGSGNNATIGQHYYLHCSDQRVFGKAIKAVTGKTDSFAAGIALARIEEALFSYSLDFHSKDVVDMITNFTEAQCADDAAVLTAFMRAMGIPSHPVTADAGLETGAATWTFDTWIEYLAPVAGNAADWHVLHPHEYSGMQPESRAVFGATRGVATKSFNDYIIMAGENWVSGGLDDNTPEVTCTRNSCGEPNQQLAKAGWIVELCESGYWAQTHWDCAGVSAASLQTNGFQPDREPRFGDVLSGSLTISRPPEQPRSGRLIVELVSRDPRSMLVVEGTFGRMVSSVTFEGEQPLTLPVSLRLPPTLPPGRILLLWVRLDGQTVLWHQLEVPPRYSIGTDLPSHLDLAQEEIARIRIHNTSDTPVRNVTAVLHTPYAVETTPSEHRLAIVEADEGRDLIWTVRAVAPLASGSAHVEISTSDGGGALVAQHFDVTGPEIYTPRPAITK